MDVLGGGLAHPGDPEVGLPLPAEPAVAVHRLHQQRVAERLESLGVEIPAALVIGDVHPDVIDHKASLCVAGGVVGLTSAG
jgi:hypothetical protein